ncbi:MAG: YjbQ family protein [Candidatus Hydrogenedentes bacterium]|nr:YjbQ family protein [Candidatus Hydrogenedentota bacterium]
MLELTVESRAHTQFINLDALLRQALRDSDLADGLLHVHVPHTTAGVTINENADPDVVADMTGILERLVPWRGNYAHAEGNSAAHVKASLMGFSVTVPVRGGKLMLGTWQSVYFCEFDGPRRRKVWVTTMPK